jgi:hypothetical protein
MCSHPQYRARSASAAGQRSAGRFDSGDRVRRAGGVEDLTMLARHRIHGINE